MSTADETLRFGETRDNGFSAEQQLQKPYTTATGGSTLERTSTGAIATDCPYEVLYSRCRDLMGSLGGKLVEDDKTSGILEAKWRYGIDPLGRLRVRAQFTTIERRTEVVFRGRFTDAISSKTSAAAKKRDEVETQFIAEIERKAGLHMAAPPQNITPVHYKSKAVTGILALIFGGLGVHRFYLGTWGIGLIYLLILLPLTVASGFPFSIIVSLIDAVHFYGMRQTRFEQRYSPNSISPFKL